MTQNEYVLDRLVNEKFCQRDVDPVQGLVFGVDESSDCVDMLLYSRLFSHEMYRVVHLIGSFREISDSQSAGGN